jgi:membrane protein
VLAIGVVLPLALKVLGTNGAMQFLAGAMRWVVLWIVAALSLSALYRYAPSRQPARWRWVTWGSAIAASLWIVVSVGFALYVGTFAAYGKTYGALGGVIALLMWFYLSSFVIVVGAEINAEMERQTKRDTTDGPEAPLGHRGAFAADTVGASAGTAPATKEPERKQDSPAIAEQARAGN